MATLRVRAQTDGMQRVQDDFDGLTRAQQKMILQGSQVGKQFDKIQKKLDGSGKSAKGFAGNVSGLNNLLSQGARLATGFVGGFAGMRGVQMITDELRKDFEEFLKVLRDAEKVGGQVSKTIGGTFLNAGDLAENPAEARRVFGHVQQIALRRGQSSADVQGAFLGMRPQTPGVTDDQRLAALDLGFKAKQLDSDFDATGFATAILKAAQEQQRQGQRFDVNEASDIFFALADQFGGNTNEFGAPFSRMIGLTSTGADLQQLGGAMAFGVASTQKTPEAVIEALAPLLTKLAAEDQIKIGERNVRLTGDDPIAKLNDFVDRMEAGEFGDNQSAIIQDLVRGGGGINTQLLVGQIIAQREAFNRSVTAGISPAPGALDSRFQAARSFDPVFDERQRSNEWRAASFAAASGDTEAQRMELQAQQLEELYRQFGRDPERSTDPFASMLPLSWQRTPSERFRAELGGGANFGELQGEEFINLLGGLDPRLNGNVSAAEGQVWRERRAAIFGAVDEGGIEAGAQEAVIQGLVNFSDGLNRQEQALLRIATFNETFIQQLNEALRSNNQEMVTEMTRQFEESWQRINEERGRQTPTGSTDVEY